MKIVLANYYRESDAPVMKGICSISIGNNLLYPGVELVRRLKLAGHEVGTLSDSDPAKADLVFFSGHDAAIYSMACSLPSEIVKVFVEDESVIYTPYGHDLETLARGCYRYAVLRDRGLKAPSIIHFDMPFAGRQASMLFEPKAEKIFHCGVVVASNRYGGGVVYERRKLLEELAGKGIIHLYGSGWVEKIGKGRVEDKLAAMAPYRYALVVENAVNSGYVTEKLPDAILAGLPSIYFGDIACAERRFPDCFVPLGELDYRSFKEALNSLNNHYDSLLEGVKKAQLASDGWCDSFFNAISKIITEVEADHGKHN